LEVHCSGHIQKSGPGQQRQYSDQGSRFCSARSVDQSEFKDIRALFDGGHI